MSSDAPNLEERFLEPPGWRWHSFNRAGRTIRFGSAFPQDSVPDAVVVCLPGLSEYAEKYFETARDLLNKNLAFWIIDWPGQGLSSRYLENPHKRHSQGFQHYVNDLHDWILGYIKHASVHPDVGRVPMAMLGHSMGANIGLHYLKQHTDIFECAAFSAPMFGIKAFRYVPFPTLFTGLAWLIADTSYVTGGGDWREDIREPSGHDIFSSDPARGSIHNAWCLFNPDLQVGNITYGWLHEAVRSCSKLQKSNLLKSIQTHCMIALAGQESLVDNNASKKIAKTLQNVDVLELPNARHEILMEKDESRSQFLDSFYQLIKENIIERPETLKPF